EPAEFSFGWPRIFELFFRLLRRWRRIGFSFASVPRNHTFYLVRAKRPGRQNQESTHRTNGALDASPGGITATLSDWSSPTSSAAISLLSFLRSCFRLGAGNSHGDRGRLLG